MRATGNTTHADGARPRPRKRSIQAAWAVLLLVPTLVVLPLATPALASHGPGVTHDQTAFVSSLDRPTLEDFERFAANEVMTTQIPGLVLSSAANNVTILDNVAASSGTKLLWGGFPASSGQRQQYHLTFTTPVRAVGFNLDDVYPNLATSPQVTIRFSDGSAQVVYSVPDTDSNVRTPIYFGYQRATASVSEVIVESGFESDGVNFEEMGIDDLAFTRTVAGPTPGQRIVFASNRTGVYQIWGVGPDGSDLQQVTTAAGPNTDPHWSPDGHKIVFVSQRNGDPEIYVYNVVTGVETRMTNNPGFDADPAWSPDGTKIAFASSRAGSQSFDIYQISAGGPENVDNPAANLTNNPAWDSFPAYDAAGNVLFQSRDRTGSDFDIFRRRVVGPSVLFDALTSNDINDQGVQGSPVDAQVITYASENGAGGYSLHVKALVDAVDRQVTATTPFYDDTPTFAPDGTALAYTHRDGGGHIRVLPLDGSASLPLATVASDDGSPSWSSTLKLTVSKPDTIASPSQIPATDIPTQNRSAAIESAPLAMTPSLTPLAMTPSLTPLAMTPSLAPLAMTPSLTPLAMTPSLVPLAMTPSLTPLAMHPSLAPLAMTPSLTPAALDTLRRQPFSSLTISSPPGAESLFVGSALAGRALQDFSIYDAVADPVAGPRLAALLYQNVDIARALPAVGLGMLLLGDTRLAAINSSVVPWCSTLEALGYGPGGGCGGPELTATTNGAPDPRQGLSARPIDLAIAGVPFDHADHPIHLHRVRMGDIALASDAPLLDVRVADTQALRASNLGAIPTSALPVDVQANPALIDCAGGYCTPDTSLYEARRDGRLQDGFLFRHLGATVADLLLGEVVFGLAGVNTVPYEDYTSSQLGVLPYQAPGSSSRVTYTLTSKDPTGFGGARAVSMKLPATFTALPGTSSLTVDGVPYAVAPTITPAADGATISWSLTDLGDGSTVSASIDAAPGLLLGHFVASARAVAGSTEQVLTGQAAVNVGEANEPNDTPETAALLAPDTLVFGHTASGIDYYKVNVPPGAVADVILGNRESGDNDLVVYYPAGAAGVSPDDRLITAIANQASSKTYADQGTSPTLLGEPVSGGTLDDVPLLDRPVAGVSDTRFRANERVIFQALPVSSGPSEYLIQVSSYLNQGSFGPYSLRLAIRPAAPTPACSARTGVTSTDWSGSRLSMPSAPLASDRKTLFLVNEDRMRDLYPGNETVGGVSVNRVDALLSNLRELASHPKVNGVIVPLDADPTFRLRSQASDANPCDPLTSNRVVRAGHDVMARLTAGSNAIIRNVVLVGSGEVVPKGLHTDGTQNGNESQFTQELRPLFAQSNNSVLGSGANLPTDDAWGAIESVPHGPRFRYVPVRGVGRLVDSPSEIRAAMQRFIDSNGRLARSTAFTAGAYFMKDLATEVDRLMEANTGAAQPEVSSDGWSRQTVLDNTVGAADPPDFISINTHSNPFASGPPVGPESPFRASDLDAAGAKLAGSVLLGIGCHTGSEIADVLLSSPATEFGQAATRNGALSVGQTGYGLGLPDRIAFSERLLVEFVRRLDGTLTIGEAMAAAKRAYLPVASAYDEKTFSEINMSGLPMYEVGVPRTPVAPTSAAVPTGTDPVSGLQTASVTVLPDLAKVTTANGSFWEQKLGGAPGTGGTLDVQYRPIQARLDLDVTQPFGVAGGAWVEARTNAPVETGFDPVFVAPALAGSVEAPIEPQSGDVVFPAAPISVVAAAGRQKISVVPTQFESTGTIGGKTLGRSSRATELGIRVFYAPPGNTDVKPPTITSVGAVKAAGVVTFVAQAIDESPLKRASVLFDDSAGTHYVELTNGGNGLWTAASPFVGTSVRYEVRFLDAGGNVAVTKNKGGDFEAAPAPVAPAGITAQVVGSTPVNGYYGAGAKAELLGDGLSFEYRLDGAPGWTAYTAPVPINGDGAHTLAYRASTGATGVLVVPVDTAAPVVTILTPTPGQTFLPGQVVLSNFRCDDTTVTTCRGSINGGASFASGAPLDTTKGAKTLTVTGVDAAGHQTVKSVSYGVSYDFRGFLSPVRNDVLNVINAGSTVPMKWQLKDSAGYVRDLNVVKVVSSAKVVCPASLETIALVWLDLPLDKLIYDVANEQYLYGWKTDKLWAKTCRDFKVQLDDGSVRLAHFQLK